MKLPIGIFLLLTITRCVLANMNPYIPVLVVPKNPIIKCPSSCSSAKDCFMVHPLSDTHFYSCFHGKAMVHQCPSGKTFSDEKHQCLKSIKTSASDSLSNAKITKLTEKIVLFEHLIDAFQRKLERVQEVIIESDNKIGLLGKFLLKALKHNRENFCDKNSAFGKATQTSEVVAPAEPELDVALPPKDDEVEAAAQANGLSIGDDDELVDNLSPDDAPPKSAMAKVEASPKESLENTTGKKASDQQKFGQPKSDHGNGEVEKKKEAVEQNVEIPSVESATKADLIEEQFAAVETKTEPPVEANKTETKSQSEVTEHHKSITTTR